ncbi:MAG: UvrD-helicase domain-containing protein [Candidatus Accumulibacter sp.]|jgi:ATP-dependent helicase/nuclease subunit A|nr:UvrD-helicase domain-containing protein [Accumulibacter sp.]
MRNRPALDPTRSAVVEACAGSGKTWLLASRILNLLLSGAAPGEILAITFTRKAAREIEDRVVDWMRFLATGDDERVVEFLAERGVSANETTLRAARGLYESSMTARSRLTLTTFHGWYLRLIDAAPISSGLTGCVLVEPDSRSFDAFWRSFVSRLREGSEPGAAFKRLFDGIGYGAVRALFRRAMDRRIEWMACGEDGTDPAEKIVALLGENVGEPGDAVEAFFADGWDAGFREYLAFLEANTTKTAQETAEQLRAALDPKEMLNVPNASAQRFECLQGVVLKKDGTPKQLKPSEALKKRLGAEKTAAFVETHETLAGRLVECLERQTAEGVLAFNRDACAAFSAFLAHTDAVKRERRQIDYVDAEWNVLRLLGDERTAAFLQARLDARYRHVLLDEFQDTNPIQWRILLSWLAAYSDGVRPTVFLVGDPKQSIYRFRQAEPRLFSAATDFLKREYGAALCTQDATYRNAEPIVRVVNALFSALPAFTPFRAHASLAGDLPGRVELLPLFEKGEAEAGLPSRVGLRDPLVEPEVEVEDARREMEADALAEKIDEIVGRDGIAWQIVDKTPEGREIRRPAAYGDIMLLVRSRSHLPVYEHALAAAGIPFEVGARGGLLSAPEVRDCVALLEFLILPLDDLKLAHVLKSPLFACDDEELTRIARLEGASWWRRVQSLAAKSDSSLKIKRAARLLESWLAIANRLPAHDLIDRIFHEGELVARTRAAVPETLSASVEANLRAFTAFALELDAGRYPSLPRFIAELRGYRDADDADAPDKGEIASAGVGRVRILTIHGAKGLEAPIVWLLGASDATRTDAYGTLLDWPPESAVPRHFSFYTRRDEHDVLRRALFDAERAAENREELNLLYVAITRARQVFIASGVKRARGDGASFYRRIEAALRFLGDDAEPGAGAEFGDEIPRVPACEGASGASIPAALDTPPPVGAVGEYRVKSVEGADDAVRFGILLHSLLENRSEGASAKEDSGFDDAMRRRAEVVADRLLSSPGLARFFDPARYEKAWNEIEIAHGEGRMMRIDRLVDCGDALWVLDYKSSRPETERIGEYREQVSEYCRAVSAAFPSRKVRGALVFADASLVEVVQRTERPSASGIRNQETGDRGQETEDRRQRNLRRKAPENNLSPAS